MVSLPFFGLPVVVFLLTLTLPWGTRADAWWTDGPSNGTATAKPWLQPFQLRHQASPYHSVGLQEWTSEVTASPSFSSSTSTTQRAVPFI